MGALDKKTTLVTTGDSWTFGSEIVSPDMCLPGGQPSTGKAARYKPGCSDFDSRNDAYRTPKIWPTHVAEMLSIPKLVNLAAPARSNDTIYESTINWLLENYISKNKDTNDLLLIIGWSSPERKNIIINETDLSETATWLTLWPSMTDTSFYKSSVVRDFFKFYVTHLWIEQEYIKRFVEQNYQLQLFCKYHNIDYFVFNAFYQTRGTDIDDWVDVSVEQTIFDWTALSDGWGDIAYNWRTIKQSLIHQWQAIDSTNFINKDSNNGSFKGYIYDNVPYETRMCNWHPSPESHYAWAVFLVDYIRQVL